MLSDTSSHNGMSVALKQTKVLRQPGHPVTKSSRPHLDPIYHRHLYGCAKIQRRRRRQRRPAQPDRESQWFHFLRAASAPAVPRSLPAGSDVLLPPRAVTSPDELCTPPPLHQSAAHDSASRLSRRTPDRSLWRGIATSRRSCRFQSRVVFSADAAGYERVVSGWSRSARPPRQTSGCNKHATACNKHKTGAHKHASIRFGLT